MRRRLFGLAAAGLLLALLLPGSALASCLAMPLPEHAANAHVIVTGKVTEVKQPPKGGTHITFTIDRVYKGSPANPILIYSESGAGMATSVDYFMQQGELHTLYLQAGEGGTFYTTNLCTGSHPGPATADEVKLLGEGKAAPAPSAQPPEPARPPLTRTMIPLIAMAIAVIAVGGVILAPRLRRKS